MIPLPRMGEYCDGIERINIELSTQNKIQLCDALTEFLSGELPLDVKDAEVDRDTLLADHRAQALEQVAKVRRRWQWLLDNLDTPLAEAEQHFAEHGIEAGELSNRAANPTLFHAQDYSIRVSWKEELRPLLELTFDGALFARIMARITEIHREILRGRVFVALHMHAGDGNVHQPAGQLRPLRNAADRQPRG